MKPTGQLLHYWAKELLNAFKDLVYKSTYRLKSKISLANIYVYDSGLGLYLDGLEFGPECENTKEGFKLYEGKCMKNYAEVVVRLLYPGTEKVADRWEDLRKIVDPVLYYILWFMHKESKERKTTFLDGLLFYPLTCVDFKKQHMIEYEKSLKESAVPKPGSAKSGSVTVKKDSTTIKPKGEETKRKSLTMHTMVQHRYFTLFEENTEMLLEEYSQMVGESTGPSSVAY